MISEIKAWLKRLKRKYLTIRRKKFPEAKIFGITTGLAVMKINYELGYKPVTFSELTSDPEFWKGCQTCTNYDVFQRTKQKMCLCTGMLYDGKKNVNKKHPYDSKILSRLKRIKQNLFLKKSDQKNKKTNNYENINFINSGKNQLKKNRNC